jgi:hypothetical protein
VKLARILVAGHPAPVPMLNWRDDDLRHRNPASVASEADNVGVGEQRAEQNQNSQYQNDREITASK